MKKQTKKQKLELAKREHLKFLKRKGLSERTVCKSKPSNFPIFLREGVYVEYQQNLSNTVQGEKTSGSKKGILFDVINYTEQDRAIAQKMARRVSPEYNKGGLQYITPGADLTTLGKKV